MSKQLVESFVGWAQREQRIRALVMIGSQARQNGRVGAADQYSDWDFQVVTTEAKMFTTSAWVSRAGISRPLAYCSRSGRLNGATKISAVFPSGELDLVLIPIFPIILAKLVFELKFGRCIRRRSQRLSNLAQVVRAGHRVLKGGPRWVAFFEAVATQVEVPRASNEVVCALAEAFVCDYVSIQQKLLRGELIAAQRWLHCHLVETNFTLLHELRLRTGGASFPDARRIELIADHWNDAVRIAAMPETKALICAVEQSAQTMRELMAALVGDKWTWPELPSRLRAE